MSERDYSWDPEELEREALLEQLGSKLPSGRPKGDVVRSTALSSGYGSPESGFGAGGVDNPAYRGPSQNTAPSAVTSSANAPRLTQSNGAWTLNEHGNQRHLQGNEVKDAQKYVDDFWTKFPTGFQPDNPNSLNDAYLQFTGREGDAAGLAAHAKNPNGFAGAINTIANSAEANTFRNRPGAPASGNGAGGTNTSTGTGASGTGGTPPPANVFDTFRTKHFGTGSDEEILRNAYRQFTGRDADAAGLAAHLKNPGGLDGALRAIYDSAESKAYGKANPFAWAGMVTPVDAPTPTPPPAPSGTPYTGFNATHDFSAFDTAREQNPEKSAKDAFAMLSNRAPAPPFHDKAAMGAWFKQHVQPEFEKLGHKVISVDGDKFTYTNHEGTFIVDMAQNAGAPAGSMLQRLQWGADPADAATRQRYASPSSASAPSGHTAPAPLADVPFNVSSNRTADDDEDVMAQIQAEIDALMNGESTPMEKEALLRLLTGA